MKFKVGDILVNDERVDPYGYHQIEIKNVDKVMSEYSRYGVIYNNTGNIYYVRCSLIEQEYKLSKKYMRDKNLKKLLQ